MGKVLQRLGQQDDRDGHSDGTDGKTVSVKIPGDLNWMIWRVVGKRIATLKEVRQYYDLVDLIDAHRYLDLQDELKIKASEAPPERRQGLR